MCKHLSGLSLYHVMECGVWHYPMGKEGPVYKESFKGEIRDQNFCAFVTILIAEVESWWYEDGKCGCLLGPHTIRHSAMFYVSVLLLQPLLLLWKAIETVKHHLNFSHHSRYKLSEVLCRKNNNQCLHLQFSNVCHKIFSLLYAFCPCGVPICPVFI